MISNSSGFEIALIARLNTTEPLDSELVISNPCEFAATISVPVFLGAAGLNPSNPPWKGTTNFLCLICESANVIFSLASENVEPNVVASACPSWSSKLIVVLFPTPAPTAGFVKYCLFVSFAKSKP